jgi:hypothetical protein
MLSSLHQAFTLMVATDTFTKLWVAAILLKFGDVKILLDLLM